MPNTDNNKNNDEQQQFSKQFLQTVYEHVNTLRAQTHGNAVRNHKAIGELWRVILSHYLNIEIKEIPPFIVALMQDAVKTVRAISNPDNIDNLHDKVGYTLIAGLAKKEEEKENAMVTKK